MAAGLGFKDFSTGEVLTAADVDGYLMQGIWVFASTAARDAAVTSPQEGNFAFTKDTNSLWYYDGAAWVASGATGDIEGVTAGVGISGGGTSGTVTVTNSMATAIDAKGDLVAGTGADTFAKLTVGANNTVLTADSAEATGLKWATPSSGGMTLISTTTLSGATTTLSSIPGTYNTLYVVVRNYLPATDLANLRMIINGDSGARYSLLGTDNASGGTFTFGASFMDIHNSADNVTSQSFAQITFPDYANATTWKMAQITAINTNGTTTTSMNWRSQVSSYNQTPAITSLTFQLSAGNFTSGSVLLYGVK